MAEPKNLSEFDIKILNVIDLSKLIQDPFLRTTAIAKSLPYSASNKEVVKYAIKLALDSLEQIEDPIEHIKATIQLAYSFGKLNLKFTKKTFNNAISMIMELPPDVRDPLLLEVVKMLIKLGDLDEATLHAVKISNSRTRSEILTSIIRKYISVGKIRKIYFILDQIDEEPYYSVARVETIKFLLDAYSYPTAIKLIKELKNAFWIKEAIKLVIKHLVTSENAEETEKYLNSLIGTVEFLSKAHGIDITSELVVIFSKYGYFGRAFALLKQLPKEKIVKTLKETTKAVMTTNNIELITKFLSEIPTAFKDFIFKEAMNIILENPKIEHAYIVKLIQDNTENGKILTKVCSYYTKINYPEFAIKIADRITDKYEKSLALGSIALYLLKHNDISKALDILYLIEDKEILDWLLNETIPKVVKYYKEKFLEDKFDKMITVELTNLNQIKDNKVKSD